MSLKCTSTHCERSQECRSPHACTGDGKRLWPDKCVSEDEQYRREHSHRTRDPRLAVFDQAAWDELFDITDFEDAS
jgi:hypothetical protein